MTLREKVADIVFLECTAAQDGIGVCLLIADRILALVAEDRRELVEALRVACRLMGHADIDWPESIDAALAKVEEERDV